MSSLGSVRHRRLKRIPQLRTCQDPSITVHVGWQEEPTLTVRLKRVRLELDFSCLQSLRWAKHGASQDDFEGEDTQREEEQ